METQVTSPARATFNLITASLLTTGGNSCWTNPEGTFYISNVPCEGPSGIVGGVYKALPPGGRYVGQQVGSLVIDAAGFITNGPIWLKMIVPTRVKQSLIVRKVIRKLK